MVRKGTFRNRGRNNKVEECEEIVELMKKRRENKRRGERA